MYGINSANKEKVKQLLKGLEGMNETEWSYIKGCIDFSFHRLHCRQSEENILNVNENVLNKIDCGYVDLLTEPFVSQ